MFCIFYHIKKVNIKVAHDERDGKHISYSDTVFEQDNLDNLQNFKCTYPLTPRHLL